MPHFKTLGIALLLAGAPTFAASGAVLKQEPPMGKLKQGQRVLVDDGSCGAGKIKEVTGGNHWKVGGNANSSIVRTYRCVPRRGG